MSARSLHDVLSVGHLMKQSLNVAALAEDERGTFRSMSDDQKRLVLRLLTQPQDGDRADVERGLALPEAQASEADSGTKRVREEDEYDYVVTMRDNAW